MKLVRAFLLTLVFLILPWRAGAAGNTYYISPTGNDANACTQSAPCKTLPRADDLAQPGDTVLALTGTYSVNTSWTVRALGSASQPIRFAAAPGARPILNASTISGAGSTTAVIKFADSAYVEFSGFAVCCNAVGRGISVDASHHITISDNEVFSIGERSIGGNGKFIFILRNYVHDGATKYVSNTGAWPGAISSYTDSDGLPSEDWTISDNEVAGNHGECVIFLRLRRGLGERNKTNGCLSVNYYIDKASDITLRANSAEATMPGYGKTESNNRPSNGVTIAQEGSAPVISATNILIEGNTFGDGLYRGINYFESGDNPNTWNTYTSITIRNNTFSDSIVNYPVYFQAVDSWRIQPCCSFFTGNSLYPGGNGALWAFGNPAAWTVSGNVDLSRLPTATRTATATATGTATASATATATNTSSPTFTATATATDTPSATPTPTASATATHTATPSPSTTPSPTTATETGTPTTAPTPTDARVILWQMPCEVTPDYADGLVTCYATPTETATASPTPTDTDTPTPAASASTQDGCMVNINKQAGLVGARALHCQAIRPVQAVFLDGALGCPECLTARDNGWPVVLTVRINTVQSYGYYFSQMITLLNNIPSPAVIVASNEADNTSFWPGDAASYGDYLRAVCDMAHSRGAKCADSGYTWKVIACAAGAPAIDFACDPARVQRANALLALTAQSGADFVNFHYYDNGATQFAAILNYVTTTTGLPAIVGEWGTRTGVAQQVLDVITASRGLDYAIVYTPLSGPGAYVPLINADGTLSDAGQAFAGR